MNKIIYIVMQGWGSGTEEVGIDAVPFTKLEDAKKYFDMTIDDYCESNEIQRCELNYETSTCVRHIIHDEDVCFLILESEVDRYCKLINKK